MGFYSSACPGSIYVVGLLKSLLSHGYLITGEWSLFTLQIFVPVFFCGPLQFMVNTQIFKRFVEHPHYVYLTKIRSVLSEWQNKKIQTRLV
jgi:hypothetical protein